MFMFIVLIWCRFVRVLVFFPHTVKMSKHLRPKTVFGKFIVNWKALKNETAGVIRGWCDYEKVG